MAVWQSKVTLAVGGEQCGLTEGPLRVQKGQREIQLSPTGNGLEWWCLDN